MINHVYFSFLFHFLRPGSANGPPVGSVRKMYRKGRWGQEFASRWQQAKRIKKGDRCNFAAHISLENLGRSWRSQRAWDGLGILSFMFLQVVADPTKRRHGWCMVKDPKRDSLLHAARATEMADLVGSCCDIGIHWLAYRPSLWWRSCPVRRCCSLCRLKRRNRHCAHFRFRRQGPVRSNGEWGHRGRRWFGHLVWHFRDKTFKTKQSVETEDMEKRYYFQRGKFPFLLLAIFMANGVAEWKQTRIVVHHHPPMF